MKRRKKTHHDTTILSSLDFCYTFLRKRSYQAVVSAAEEHLDLTFNKRIIFVYYHCIPPPTQMSSRVPYLFFAAGQHADNAKTN